MFVLFAPGFRVKSLIDKGLPLKLVKTAFSVANATDSMGWQFSGVSPRTVPATIARGEEKRGWGWTLAVHDVTT
jgi:hypothetical protein